MSRITSMSDHEIAEGEHRGSCRIYYAERVCTCNIKCPYCDEPADVHQYASPTSCVLLWPKAAK